MNRGPLKIGILLNTKNIPAWEYVILEKLVVAKYANVEVLIQLQDNRSGKLKFFSAEKFKWLNMLIYLHVMLDKIIFKGWSHHSIPKNISSLLNGIITININGNNKKLDNQFLKEDYELIKKYNLDVILKFGRYPIPFELNRLAKFGIWYHNIDSSSVQLPFGYIELINKSPTTKIILYVSSPDYKDSTILYQSQSYTDDLSITKNQQITNWRASLFIPRILEKICNSGEIFFKDSIEKNNDSLYREGQKISSYVFVSGLLNLAFSFFKQKAQKISLNEHWFILFKTGEFCPISDSFENHKVIESPKDRFWADPFVVSKENRHYIFIEDYPYEKQKGHIALLELGPNGQLLNTEKIIEQPYHMSYPFVFDVDGQYFMIPETIENHTIELYKCTNFPYKWEYEMNLMEDIYAVDSTVFRYMGKWWLFTNIDETRGLSSNNDELFLFYTDNIFKPDWVSHPMNPVVTDVTRARPAGKIFISDDKIYRPSQDCSEDYGNALNLNEITKLNEFEYSEKVVSKVRANWNKNMQRIHTYNFDENISVIDGYCKIRKA